tara:strand:- start:353 stop:541 length:189 start_codon:yes stop_codon:yes gene_type:complete
VDNVATCDVRLNEGAVWNHNPFAGRNYTLGRLFDLKKKERRAQISRQGRFVRFAFLMAEAVN